MDEQWIRRYQAEAEAEAKARRYSMSTERKLFLIQLVDTRLKSKLSQAALAARLNVRQPVIAKIESKHGNPKLETLLKILRVLDAELVIKCK